MGDHRSWLTGRKKGRRIDHSLTPRDAEGVYRRRRSMTSFTTGSGHRRSSLRAHEPQKLLEVSIEVQCHAHQSSVMQ